MMNHADLTHRTEIKVVGRDDVHFGALPTSISMKPVTHGHQTAAELVVADDPAGFCAVWQARPGVYPRVKDQRGSAMLILSGDATVSDADGMAHEVHEGSVLLLPYRWEGEWAIRRTIRKVYVYSWPAGEPDESPTRAVSRAGLEYADRIFHTVVSPSEHRGAFPEFRADVVSDGINGLCALIQVDDGEYVISGGTRWTYLYVQHGECRFTPRGDSPSVRTQAGAVIAVPGGWLGSAEFCADFSAFAFITADSSEMLGDSPV